MLGRYVRQETLAVVLLPLLLPRLIGSAIPFTGPPFPVAEAHPNQEMHPAVAYDEGRDRFLVVNQNGGQCARVRRTYR